MEKIKQNKKVVKKDVKTFLDFAFKKYGKVLSKLAHE